MRQRSASSPPTSSASLSPDSRSASARSPSTRWTSAVKRASASAGMGPSVARSGSALAPRSASGGLEPVNEGEIDDEIRALVAEEWRADTRAQPPVVAVLAPATRHLPVHARAQQHVIEAAVPARRDLAAGM